MIEVEPHPLLDVGAFVTTFPRPIGEMTEASRLAVLLRLDAEGVPMHADDAVRAAVRDLLRHGGYKPTGRGKPASEYLLRAAGDGSLGVINVAVDACNAVSLHSRLPISVVDLDRARPPFRIGVAPEGASYVFNAAGQVIDLAGLLCLFDAEGPSANPVKDSQRTKTHAGTRRTLSVVWGFINPGDRGARINPGGRDASIIPGDRTRTELAVSWYRELLESFGATTERV